jgi:hypothetical protein
VRPVRAADEHAHEPEGAKNWRENWWLCFFDPEREIRGVVYANLLPGEERGFALVMLFQGESPVFVYSDQSVPLHECSQGEGLVGPVRFTCDEPLGSWRIEVSHPSAKVDLRWSAIAPAYDWEWGLATGSRHYEQSGRVEGTVDFAGDSLSITGWGQRDRAWGHRDPSILIEAWSTRVFFGDEVQHASILRLADEALMFGYRIKDGDRLLLERLDLEITPTYPGGPPLTTSLAGTFEGGLQVSQEVGLVGVIPIISAIGGISTNQFFTFSDFADGQSSAVGQLDYWWTTPRDTSPRRSIQGNNGCWVDAEAV